MQGKILILAFILNIISFTDNTISFYSQKSAVDDTDEDRLFAQQLSIFILIGYALLVLLA